MSSATVGPVDDVGAAELGDHRSQLLEREGRATELVDRVVVAVPDQRGRGRRSVVGAGGGGDPPVAGGAHDGPAGQVLADLRGVVLGVPAVAQDRERHTGRLQHLLGAPGAPARGRPRGVRAQHAGVRDARDPGPFAASMTAPCSRRAAPARCPRPATGRPPRPARPAGCRAASSRPRAPRRRAGRARPPGTGSGRSRRCPRGDPALQEGVDREGAEVTGGPGDGIGGHVRSPSAALPVRTALTITQRFLFHRAVS